MSAVSPLQTLPQEIKVLIVNCLQPNVILNLFLTHRSWHAVTKDPNFWGNWLRSGYGVIDRTFWAPYAEAYKLDAADTFPLGQREASVAWLMSQRAEGGKAALVTIPAGLTYPKLRALAEEQHISIDGLLDETVPAQLAKWAGTDPVKKTYRVAITSSPLIGSRRDYLNEPLNITSRMRPGDRLPVLIEAVVLTFAKCMDPEVKRSSTYMYCFESPDPYRVIVGGIFSRGFIVDTSWSIDGEDVTQAGVAAAREI